MSGKAEEALIAESYQGRRERRRSSPGRRATGRTLLDGALKLSPSDAGVLPHQHLIAAIGAGVVDAGPSTVLPANVQPASIDLRLGEMAYRIRCSFLPSGRAVRDRVAELVIDELDLRGPGAVLETNRPYLVPLKERLALPATVRAKANPKSSTGRADVFTRVITDGNGRFDDIPAGYHGGLYLEVVPLSFPVRVAEDLSLSQLRLVAGRPRLSDDELRALHGRDPVLYTNGEPVPGGELVQADGLFLGLDLRGRANGSVGYRARAHGSAPLLDLTRSGSADPVAYWERVVAEPGDRVVLSPDTFYLLMSYESVTVPPTLAAEMTAFDPTSGELRTHYAGFFDPGFGYGGGASPPGSTAALEVRAHDVPFMIEHRQRVCKLTFERMLAEPDQLYGSQIGSTYQRQTDTLGKHFRLPAAARPSPDADGEP
jgi:dCTP deaminase